MDKRSYRYASDIRIGIAVKLFYIDPPMVHEEWYCEVALKRIHIEIKLNAVDIDFHGCYIA